MYVKKAFSVTSCLLSGKKILMVSLLCMATLNLSACDYFDTGPKPNKFDQRPFQTSDRPIVTQTQEIAQSTAEDNPFAIEEIIITKDGTPTAAPTPMPAIGLKTDEMFTVALSDDNERFVRLENAVQQLTDKINAMDPAMTRLMQIDRDMNNITHQLEILINERKAIAVKQPEFKEVRAEMAPTNEVVSENKTLPEKIEPAGGNTPVQNTSFPKNILQNIRIGDHSDKTRIVFETSEKPDFSFEIDNLENLMMIDTPQMVIDFNPTSLAQKSSLIDDIQITQNSENQKLVLALAQHTEKINQGYFPPDSKHPYHRLFIDLKR